MDKLQIEALEPIKFSREAGGPMEKGDIRTFTGEQVAEAQTALKHGWSNDVAGVVPTGVRRVNASVIQPHDTVVTSNG